MKRIAVLPGCCALCASGQKARGGRFYVVDDKVLSDGIGRLIGGATAPRHASRGRIARAGSVAAMLRACGLIERFKRGTGKRPAPRQE